MFKKSNSNFLNSWSLVFKSNKQEEILHFLWTIFSSGLINQQYSTTYCRSKREIKKSNTNHTRFEILKITDVFFKNNMTAVCVIFKNQSLPLHQCS